MGRRLSGDKKKVQDSNNKAGRRRKNLRSRKKFPGLEKGMNLKIRWDELDNDYLEKLSDKEKEWLNNFNEEYVGANFRHPGKVLHKTKKGKRNCYSRNNSRNRCIYGLAKARNEVIDSAKDLEEKPSENYEDALIEYIDNKKS